MAKCMIPLLGIESTNDLQAFDMNEQDLVKFLDYLDNVSFACIAVEDGVPFACYGAMFEEFDRATTWMLCTDDCFGKHGKWITLQVAKYIRRNKALFPDVTLELCSGNQNHRAHRWFELLGFVLDESFSHPKQVKYLYRDRG
jgi:hypothetical protein